MPNAFDGNGCWVRPVSREEMERSPTVPLRPGTPVRRKVSPNDAISPSCPDRLGRPETLMWLLTGFMMGAVGTLLIFGVVML